MDTHFVLPPPISKIKTDPAQLLQLLYNQCYWVAFGRNSQPDTLEPLELAKLGKVLELMEKDKQRRFILANMWGHKVSAADFRFSVKMLLTDGAKNRYQQYSKAAHDEWGHLDLDSLDRFFNDQQAVVSALRDSELLAARWIIGYKLGKSGPAIEPMLDLLETKLHPLWLALEPEYWKLIGVNINLPTLTVDNKEKWQTRLKVAEWHTTFVTKVGSLRGWLKLRADIAKELIEPVMSHFGQRSDDYFIKKTRWTSTLDFWLKLGFAYQHTAVMALYNGTTCPLSRWLYTHNSKLL